MIWLLGILYLFIVLARLGLLRMACFDCLNVVFISPGVFLINLAILQIGICIFYSMLFRASSLSCILSHVIRAIWVSDFVEDSLSGSCYRVLNLFDLSFSCSFCAFCLMIILFDYLSSCWFLVDDCIYDLVSFLCFEVFCALGYWERYAFSIQNPLCFFDISRYRDFQAAQ